VSYSQLFSYYYLFSLRVLFHGTFWFSCIIYLRVPPNRRVANIDARDIAVLVLPEQEKAIDEKQKKQKDTIREKQKINVLKSCPTIRRVRKKRSLWRRVVLPAMLGIALSVPTVAGRAQEGCRLHEP
jgi:hypothetical protein